MSISSVISIRFCSCVLPNLFQHLFVEETLKQVQDDLSHNIKLTH